MIDPFEEPDWLTDHLTGPPWGPGRTYDPEERARAIQAQVEAAKARESAAVVIERGLR